MCSNYNAVFLENEILPASRQPIASKCRIVGPTTCQMPGMGGGGGGGEKLTEPKLVSYMPGKEGDKNMTKSKINKQQTLWYTNLLLN